MRIRVEEGAIDEKDVEAVVVAPGGKQPAGRACIEARETEGDAEGLRSVIRSCLSAARERGIRSLALPPLCTGPGRLTMQQSAEIMFEEVHRHDSEATPLEEVLLVVEGEQALRIFEQVQDADKIRASLAMLNRERGGA